VTGTRVLVLQHDPDAAVDLARALQDGGYDAFVFDDGRAGLRAALGDPPALVLIDVLVRGMNGLDVCRRLRGDPRTGGVPVLLLAGQADEEAKAAALSAGADGCIGRSPVGPDLLRRVQALLLREGAAAPEGVLCHGGLRLDRVRHRVFVGDREARLTPAEFRLLECLMREPGRAFSRRELVEAAVSQGDSSERAVDVHVKTLRRKLARPGLVEAVRGVGYRLRPDPQGCVAVIAAARLAPSSNATNGAGPRAGQAPPPRLAALAAV
jgi:two-component system, OmpR family, phosphate regulon response regulator PhoB